MNKDDKERSDMVIFSILLMISRLVPAFQLMDSQNIVEESKDDGSREHSMHQYVSLIKAYAASGTYFVRKISAQALLPIMRFDAYLDEVNSCFDQLEDRVNGKNKLKQNEAHGLMIRIDIFLRAYFKYRDFNYSLTGISTADETAKRNQ